MGIFDFDHALLRAPGRSVVHGLRAHDGPGPTYDGVAAEHAAYAAALAEAGLTIHMLAPLEEHPDALFVEDPALVFPEAAILLRPGTATRVEEAALLERDLAALFPTVVHLAEGHADGGDILVTPDHILIGLSDRTDFAGARALAAVLDRLGRRAQIVAPPRGQLHLKTTATLIDAETVLTNPAGEASGIFDRFRQIVVERGEEAAANVLRVNDALLVSSQYPRTLDRLAREGFPVVPIDTRHVARIDAGLTCMSLRWKARPPLH